MEPHPATVIFTRRLVIDGVDMRYVAATAGLVIALAAMPIEAQARRQAHPRPAATLHPIDYTLPAADGSGDASRWLLPRIVEPDEPAARPMFRVRGTKVKMRVAL